MAKENKRKINKEATKKKKVKAIKLEMKENKGEREAKEELVLI